MTKNGIFAKLPKNFTRELIESSEIRDEISAFIDYLMDKEDKRVKSKAEYQNRWRLLNPNGNKLSRNKTLKLIDNFEEAILNMKASNEFHKNSYAQNLRDTLRTDKRQNMDTKKEAQNRVNSASNKEDNKSHLDTLGTDKGHFRDTYIKSKDLKSKDIKRELQTQKIKVTKDNLNELKVKHLPKSFVEIANSKSLNLEEELLVFKNHYSCKNQNIIDYMPLFHNWLIRAKKQEGKNSQFISTIEYKNRLDFIRSKSREIEKELENILGFSYIKVWKNRELLKSYGLGSAKINVENGGKDIILFPLETTNKEDIEILDVEVINV